MSLSPAITMMYKKTRCVVSREMRHMQLSGADHIVVRYINILIIA
jgi:hypothetical protein